MQLLWDEYFSELFADTEIAIGEDETVIMVEPEFFDWLLPLMIATPKEIMGNEPSEKTRNSPTNYPRCFIADYLYWNRISSVVTEGPQEFVDISFDFTSVLYGQNTQSPR